MKLYYDRRATWHDEYMSYKDPAQMTDRFRNVIAVIEPIVRHKHVLEIACGTGNWTQFLAQSASHVTAVDSSQKSLSIASTKLRHYTNVCLSLEDA